MKLPLKWGVLALLGLWGLHASLDEPRERMLVLVAAMGVALWTAFSLKIPPKRRPEDESLLDPPEDAQAEDFDEEELAKEAKAAGPADDDGPPRR
jgi:hypothetical protein